jgi:peptidoglycan/xylan/chitin deacetylase (PgdA/CDA1 family)
MEPESGGYLNSSMLLKASLLTIAFTTIYIYRSEKYRSLFKPLIAKKDSIATKSESKPVVKKKKKKTIYLTFDDGPNKGSRNVMAIMNEEQIPATMFVIGEHVYGSKEQKNLWDSLEQNGLFEIANHSYTHAFENRYNQFYSEPDSAAKDFARCADSLHLTSNIIRTPGRNIWRTENISRTDLNASAAAADTLQSKGFKAVGWDLEWHFTADQKLVQSDTLLIREIDSLFAKNKTMTTGHLIILAHDRTFLSTDDSAALHRLVRELKNRDEYDFETVSRYPGIVKDSTAH